MAQLMRVILDCTAVGCRKAASWALVGKDNKRYGPFCREHGMARLEALQLKEDAARLSKRKREK